MSIPESHLETMPSEFAAMEVKLAGALLRHHREAVRWDLGEAAAVLGCDRSKVSRMETGHRRPLPTEMLRLLAAYGVPPRERRAVAALTRAARAGWWSEYRGLLPDPMVDCALLESIADEILVYEPQMIPAFLQGDGYATGAAAADPALRTEDERRLSVQLTAARATALRDRQGVAVTVILGEAALMHQRGYGTLLSQLPDDNDDTGEPSGPVTLRVISFDSGVHSGIMSGPLTIMRARGVPGVGAVRRGGTGTEVSVVRQEKLTIAVRAFEAVRSAALSPGRSQKLIRKVADSVW